MIILYSGLIIYGKEKENIKDWSVPDGVQQNTYSETATVSTWQCLVYSARLEQSGASSTLSLVFCAVQKTGCTHKDFIMRGTC